MTPRIVFFGSPAFAVPALAAIRDAGMPVPLVVTQPDRPVGRHAQMRPTAVAAFASESGLDVEKPESVRGNARLMERIAAASPDAIAVVAFGRILPPEILALPRLKCVNVHASLLPRHRGASPIQAAILAGDRETGVVTMRMEEELDAGPLYLSATVVIGPRETAGELSQRLALLGGRLLVETLSGLESASLEAVPQRGEPTFCKPIRRTDGEVDWNLDALSIARRLRAFSPWPGLYTFRGPDRVKILEAEEAPRMPDERGEPGELRLVSEALLVLAGHSTALTLLRVQREGRKPVSGSEFARGLSLPSRFGAAPR